MGVNAFLLDRRTARRRRRRHWLWTSWNCRSSARWTNRSWCTLVLGWDEGRGSVTDFGWDYLPRLGYAVRDPAGGSYTLQEERAGLLHVIDDRRPRELDLLAAGGELIRRGQPRITMCRSVRPYIAG